ncbi:right-handed parallel beta-helix repeat-containing protein [Novosphingobium sp. G106]|uniref:right-handed parallel beta-helix repeat-containing protein n=1 Tax=Novosphingobium sp. G106 TaxID=2849500 RepID=UPI001C2D32AE|nr:right-handed parallel beta-helix repeat-containing protein [Novosphingobium sp. G106]MBV1689555.1 right-handed parallel beta-helix repeat-containing protein [Novosphingobium sp. G106]
MTAQAVGGPRAALMGTCSKQPGHRYVAASKADLEALLKCDLDGATIALKPGSYGRVNLGAAKGLTLLSDNPAQPASFETIVIDGGNRIALSGLRFGGSIEGLAWRVQVDDGSGIDLSELDVVGQSPPDGNVPGGVYIHNSKQVSLKRLKVSLVSNGIRLIGTRQVVVADNIIHDFGSDAIQASDASQSVISGNYISSAHPAPGDHPDGVQIFTLGNQTAQTDIVVKDNLIEKGAGGLMQGIFVTDETDRNPYANLEITNNIVIGSMYHGITIAGAASGSVRGNVVVPLDGQQNWIKLVKANALELEDNVAQDLMKDNSNLQAKAELGNNRRMIVPPADAAAASRAWKAKHLPAEASNGQ